MNYLSAIYNNFFPGKRIIPHRLLRRTLIPQQPHHRIQYRPGKGFRELKIYCIQILKKEQAHFFNAAYSF